MSAKQEHPRRRNRLAALATVGALIGSGAAFVMATAGLPAPLRTQAYADEPNGPQKVFSISDKRVAESSGLTFGTKHTDALYTLNDSGNTPDVFALDLTGKVLGTIALGGATNTDWEALTAGPEGRIWVGDIGDNDRNRESLTLYRMHEPDQLIDQRQQWSRFTVAYPDGPHDAETLLVHPKTGRVYIVTKDPQGGAIYAGPDELATGTTNTLTKIADAPAVVTDGAFLPDGSAAVVRTYGKAYVLAMPSGKVQRTVGLPTQRQGESLAISPDGKQMYAGSEGANSTVYKVSVTGPPPAASSPKPSKSASPKAGAQANGAARPAAGSKSTMKDLLGGLPWWIPALVVAAALLAGIAVFWPSRRRADSRQVRRRRDAGAADPGYEEDGEGADRFRYDPDMSDDDGWQGDEPWPVDQQQPWQADEQPWQADQPAYQNDQPGYRHDEPAYQNDQPGYRHDEPAYQNDQPGYRHEQPAWQHEQEPWQSDTPPSAPWRDRPAPGDLDWSSPPAPAPGPGAAGLMGPGAGAASAAGAGAAGAGAGAMGASAADYGERPLFADETPGYAGGPRPYDEPPGPYDQPPRQPYDEPPAFEPRRSFDEPGPFDQPPRQPYDESPASNNGRPYDAAPEPYDQPPPFMSRGSYEPPSSAGDPFRSYDERQSPPTDRPPAYSDEPPPAYRRGETGPRDAVPPRDPRGEPGRQPPAWDPPPFDPEPAPTLPWRQSSGPPSQRGGRRRADGSEDRSGRPAPPPPPGPGASEPTWPDDADRPQRRQSWQDEFEKRPRPRRLFRDDDPAD